jgi:hypothetical protein
MLRHCTQTFSRTAASQTHGAQVSSEGYSRDYVSAFHTPNGTNEWQMRGYVDRVRTEEEQTE